MRQDFFEVLEENPVIAAIKDDKGLEVCNSCKEIKIVFILYGDICSVGEIVERVKAAGKIAMIHMDLIEGLDRKTCNVDFLKRNTNADGIITTRANLVKRAKELGMYTVLRTFVLDSKAFENIEKEMKVATPDALEILPGLMPKIIRQVSKNVKIPVIAGGLISEKEDVVAALSAGAVSVSSTRQTVWMM